MSDAMERAFLRHRAEDVNLPPVLGFGVWVEVGQEEKPDAPPVLPKGKLVTQTGNRVRLDEDDPGGGGLSPTIRTNEVADPIKAIREGNLSMMHALGMSVAGPEVHAEGDLDAELRSITHRRHLVVLANGSSFQRDWSGGDPADRKMLETSERSDAIRRAMRLPTPAAGGPVAGGLVQLWMLRVRRELRSRAVSPADVLARLPVTLPAAGTAVEDVVHALRAASDGLTWDGILARVRDEAPEVGEWFDSGSLSRSRSSEFSIQALAGEYRPRAVALLRRVYEELLP